MCGQANYGTNQRHITRYRPAVTSKNPTINKNITTCILTHTQKSSVNIIVCKLC